MSAPPPARANLDLLDRRTPHPAASRPSPPASFDRRNPRDRLLAELPDAVAQRPHQPPSIYTGLPLIPATTPVYSGLSRAAAPGSCPAAARAHPSARPGSPPPWAPASRPRRPCTPRRAARAAPQTAERSFVCFGALGGSAIPAPEPVWATARGSGHQNRATHARAQYPRNASDVTPLAMSNSPLQTSAFPLRLQSSIRSGFLPDGRRTDLSGPESVLKDTTLPRRVGTVANPPPEVQFSTMSSRALFAVALLLPLLAAGSAGRAQTTPSTPPAQSSPQQTNPPQQPAPDDAGPSHRQRPHRPQKEEGGRGASASTRTRRAQGQEP